MANVIIRRMLALALAAGVPLGVVAADDMMCDEPGGCEVLNFNTGEIIKVRKGDIVNTEKGFMPHPGQNWVNVGTLESDPFYLAAGLLPLQGDSIR